MSNRLTAEQVAAEFDEGASAADETGRTKAAQAFRVAARVVRAHLIETDEQRRERFEAWCVASFSGEVFGDAFGRRDDGRYWLGWIEDRWQAWQAALTWYGDRKGASEMNWRLLDHGEIIQAGDEIDRCANPWKDDAKWEPVHPNDIGQPAPDPHYPSHRLYRRPVDETEGGGE